MGLSQPSANPISSHGVKSSSAPVQAQRENLTLFALVDAVSRWSQSEIASSLLKVDGIDEPLLSWFRRPEEIVQSTSGIDLETTRIIVFGFAWLDIGREVDLAVLRWDGKADWFGQRRAVSLFVTADHRRKTRKKQRFERMVSDVASSQREHKCYAFALGELKPAKNGPYLNVRLAGGLEEVIIFPIAFAGKWLRFEHAYKSAHSATISFAAPRKKATAVRDSSTLAQSRPAKPAASPDVTVLIESRSLRANNSSSAPDVRSADAPCERPGSDGQQGPAHLMRAIRSLLKRFFNAR